MAFIDTSETIIGVEIQQIDALYRAGPAGGTDVQVRARPDLYGEGAGDRERPDRAVRAVTPVQIQAAPLVGATGKAAIFTDRVKAAHMIQKVLLRQFAILNYVNPF